MIVTWEDVLRQQKTVRNCALVAGVLAFIGLVAGFATITTRSGWFFLLLLVPSGLMFLMFYFARKTYREMYKSVVVNKAAEGMFDSYSYKYDSGFESNEIRDAGLMTMGNRYNSEDMVEGFYKGVSFPTSIVAGMSGIHAEDFFEAEESKRADVDVKITF